MPSGVTMVIVIAAVGGVCCVALVILQVVVKFQFEIFFINVCMKKDCTKYNYVYRIYLVWLVL